MTNPKGLLLKLPEIRDDQQLWQVMTEPTERLVECMARLIGPIMVLGGSGKMGKELIGMIQRADRKAGVTKEIFVASTFSNHEVFEFMQTLGVKCFKGDLSNPAFLSSLPDAPLVVYMMGFKFGTAGDWRRTFHLNSIVPYLVGNKYSNSRIVVFSSGNPYPHTPPDKGGCVESDTLRPTGVYGWSIVARESAFATTALEHPSQKLCLYRLMYAQHLCYGVLVDLARMILHNEPISLEMPAVNLVSQRDANVAALMCLEHCSNPRFVLNVSGPVHRVRHIVRDLGEVMNIMPLILEPEGQAAMISNDGLCREMVGGYRDSYREMVVAVGNWVKKGGTCWHKPTYFGRPDHKY